MIDASTLDAHKENITPRAAGRPAAKLAHTLVALEAQKLPFKRHQNEEKKRFESQLADLDELDDPLQIYLDYIAWTHDNYPEGANAESGLLELLERCTLCFRDTPHYKNDPRYLRVWMEYTTFLDLPREVFVYLAKKDIGTGLALFYEEFSRYLEGGGKFGDAREVLEMGVERRARPVARLMRLLERFDERNDGRALASPLLRAALGGGAPAAPALALLVTSQALVPTLVNTKRRKLEVYTDEEVPSLKKSLGEGPTKDLGTLEVRKKENVFTAQPWKGETLRQKNSGPRPSSRFEVYRDDHANEVVQHKGDWWTVVRNPNKPLERVRVNMDLVYPSSTEEYCFTEVLAMGRRLRAAPKQESPIEATHTITIPLNDERDRQRLGSPLAIGGSADTTIKSPTITMVLRATTNEVFLMFNQSVATDDELDTRSETNYDDFVTETIHPQGIQRQETPIPRRASSPATPPTDLEVPSSPFIEEPPIRVVGREDDLVTGEPIVADVALQKRLLADIDLRYPGYKSSAMVAGSLNIGTFVDSTYCIRHVISDNKFLVEDSSGEFRLMKVGDLSWEWYILNEVSRRTQDPHFVRSYALLVFQDESILVMDHLNSGSLADVAANSLLVGDEALAMMLGVDLIRAVETLHGVGVLNGNITPKTCMLRFGQADWREIGLTLVNFGNAIDLTLFPENARFVNAEGERLRHEIDYIGIANVLHSLLFGTPFSQSLQLKRYWQLDIWRPLFEDLVSGIGHLRHHRLTMKQWLDQNSTSYNLQQTVELLQEESGMKYRDLLRALR